MVLIFGYVVLLIVDMRARALWVAVDPKQKKISLQKERNISP
ncbi:hypothetical protein MNV_1360011 [Candidatus Methanoperedens nitroreducens]|uniref:Uncharacterized protein n=1 Tax=Candidatus Methanoperedens nitratireducens TaxID=1392998 RepID=A0A284VKS5_9EURY|nr:hypothetical protein MNV_1360011 [Candidatus Methanoperedens nitroreducens]